MGVKTDLLEVASKVGISQPLIFAYDRVHGGSELTPKLHVTDEIRDFKLNEEDRKGYVLLTLIPGNSSLNTFTLATAFQLKGYDPIVLYNNGLLPIKPSLRYYMNATAAIELQRYILNIYKDKFGIHLVSIREILGDKYSCEIADNLNHIRSFEYNNIDLSPYAVASTRKYLQRYTLDENNTRTIEAYRGFLKGAAILADATQQIIDDFDIVAALLIEPAYIHGGVAAEACSNNNVEAYTRGGGYQHGKISFGRASNRNPFPNFADEELVSKALDTGLSEFQKRRIREVMQRRETGDIVRTHYTTDNQESIDVPEDRLVGVFSHLLWDGALAPQQAIYGDIFDWLEDTIEIGAELEETHFVIKAHPAELSKGSDQRIGDWLDENYETLPANFTVLPPDTDINTYSLIRDLDAGIVYASTVGLEMAFNGVPVVTGGYPPYHGFGITHDPATRSAYRKRIGEIDQIECSENMEKRAERFAYLLFILKEFDYPYSSIKNNQHIYISREKILSNDNVNIIIGNILNGREVIKSVC